MLKHFVEDVHVQELAARLNAISNDEGGEIRSILDGSTTRQTHVLVVWTQFIPDPKQIVEPVEETPVAPPKTTKKGSRRGIAPNPEQS